MGDMSREPSMEEILSSIRRVIARDESARTGGAPIPSPSAYFDLEPSVIDDDDQDDVLELTETNDDDMAKPTTLAATMAAMQPTPETTPDVAIDTPQLVSHVSAAASRHSLDALAAVLAGDQDVVTPAAAASSGDVTINALAEAALRPMLKAWLDANLPSMVERMVATEIARITGGR